MYLYTYGHLPENFITKSDARALGWSGGGLDDYANGKCIGGDRFGNNEGLLPEAQRAAPITNATSTPCISDSRGAKRIVFSERRADLLHGEITTSRLICSMGEP